MDYLESAVGILCFGTTDSPRKVRMVLEDAESPIRRKTVETLYKNTIDKSHVDFGDIPKSRGDISKYAGYKSLTDTLGAIRLLSKEDSAYQPINNHVTTVSTAINNILQNRNLYMEAFSTKNEILMLEYNTFTYACVEAVTAILYQFADYMKTPSSPEISAGFKNTKYRADLFFVEQLQTYNKLKASGKYQKYLAEMIRNGKENFALTTSFIVGVTAIATTVMLSIVPVTRKIIYVIQNSRGRLAECLELQAYFLEINASYLKAHPVKGDVKKTKEVLKKQEALRLKFLRLADKLRVKSIKSEELAKKTLEEEDRTITLNSVKDDINNDDVTIL